MRSFLGLANYIWDLIPNFAEIARPLYDLLKGQSKRSVREILWTESLRNCFIQLKNSIANSTFRVKPNFNKAFWLITDASDHSIGAVLVQKDEQNKNQIIYTFSKSL